MIKSIVVAFVGLVLLASSGAVAQDSWSLVGSWRLNVTCKNFEQVNTVTIGRADGRKVTGTTNVGDAFGKIGAGAFDGVNFEFSNKYRFEGRTYTEIWKGSLSRNGKFMRGAFTTNHAAAGGCRFSGPRV